MTIYFIDFENIQEIPLSEKVNSKDKVIIFIGKYQKAFKIELVKKLLLLNNVEIIKIDQQGKNNLDFHLCYHLGVQENSNDKKVNFAVISNDKYFDPIIATINKQGRKCKRVSNILIKKKNKKVAKITNEICNDTKIDTKNPNQFLPFINSIKAKERRLRPGKIKSFVNSLNAFTKQKYSETVIHEFIKLGIIEIDKRKVIYKI